MSSRAGIADGAELAAFLSRHPDVQSVQIFITDPSGVPRGKSVRREELVPGGEHAVPERLGAMIVVIRGGEVIIRDAGIARDAILARHIRPGGVEYALGRQNHLQVIFFLQPAGCGDGVPVRAEQDLVILAHAPFPAWQRAPGVTAEPRREAARVSPTADARVARGFVYLVNRL